MRKKIVEKTLATSPAQFGHKTNYIDTYDQCQMFRH